MRRVSRTAERRYFAVMLRNEGFYCCSDTKICLATGWLRAVLLAIVFLLTPFARGQGTQPLVAIHDSELTRGLETMTATGGTPTGPGTTGKQWWPTNWHYFVMPEAIKEALRSDGTAFTVIGDSN